MTSKKEPLTKLIQNAIDKGATTVEEIHKAIADLPLRMLEESELLEAPVKEVRRLQDHSIGAVYDLIREINKDVATLASELLADARKHRRTPATRKTKPAGERRSAHHP